MCPSRASVAAALLLAVAVAGCGSSGSPSPQAASVERTVGASLADLSRSDGRAFCALMTPGGRRQLGRLLHGYSCAALMAMVAEHMSPQQRAALGHVRVSGVRVHGNVAVVPVADLHSPGEALDGVFSPRSAPTKLIRISDNTWRIAA